MPCIVDRSLRRRYVARAPSSSHIIVGQQPHHRRIIVGEIAHHLAP
jgi:hypothetical protein